MDKKTMIIVATILVSSVLIGGIFGVFIANNAGSTSGGELIGIGREKVIITDNAARNVGFDSYDNGIVSMKIPRGWVVTVHPAADFIHYTFKVENPQNTNYRIYFNMKAEGFLSSETERAWYASMYPTSPYAIFPAINPQTTEQYFNIYSEAGRLSNAGNYVAPIINDFTPVETLGRNVTGGEIIRAYYTDENGSIVDGVFTATITPVSLYYATSLNVYNAMFFTAPDGELTEWEDVLNYCIGTISFSDDFVNSYYAQEQILAQTSADIARIANETSDIITSGWRNRQSTYDIISQKQSDAIMEYERVYDTQTGEIYKADLGFTDNDWNGRYQAVTDDMYNLPTSGYIEKVD